MNIFLLKLCNLTAEVFILLGGERNRDDSRNYAAVTLETGVANIIGKTYNCSKRERETAKLLTYAGDSIVNDVSVTFLGCNNTGIEVHEEVEPVRVKEVFKREVVKETTAEVIESGIYDKWLNANIVTFVGDGADKTKPLLSVHPNALYDSEFRISAAGMIKTAREKLAKGEVEDTAYFEPFYLKDFVAKKSEVHGLRRN